jgi:hypothetical protein
MQVYTIEVNVFLDLYIIYSVSANYTDRPISFPEHARSQVKGGHSSGEIELIHAEFPT